MKIILITGASTGIGASTALELAEGNKIFIHYNSSEMEAGDVAGKVQNKDGEAVLIQADLSNEAGCRSLVDQVKEKTNKLDVLFNNAGSMSGGRHYVNDLRWDTMEEMFRLNTISSMYITSLLLPLLKKGENPCIINMTSLAMRSGAPSATVYGASKAALDSFTRGIAKELAPDIRVNAVAPGVIETPFHEKFTSDEQMNKFLDSNPLNKHGTSEDIAKTVRFLIENTFLHGETIDVNGGVFMR